MVEGGRAAVLSLGPIGVPQNRVREAPRAIEKEHQAQAAVAGQRAVYHRD